MKTKNKVVKHYKDFFDLHAKGIGLTEDDHLNIDWAIALVEDLKSEQTISQEQTIERLMELVRKYKNFCSPATRETEVKLNQEAEQLLNTTEPIETSKAKGE